MSEPSWGPMDAEREEVMLIERMVIPLKPSKPSKMSRKFFFGALGARTNLN